MDFVYASTFGMGVIPRLPDDIRRLIWNLTLPVPVQWCSVCERPIAWDTHVLPTYQLWDSRCRWCKGYVCLLRET